MSRRSTTTEAASPQDDAEGSTQQMPLIEGPVLAPPTIMAHDPKLEAAHTDAGKSDTQKPSVVEAPHAETVTPPLVPAISTIPPAQATPAAKAPVDTNHAAPTPIVQPRARTHAEQNGSAVPQETVPIPVASWTGTQASVATMPEAPDKPPPLRRQSRAQVEKSATTRGIDVVERPGLLTTELRRALPPWALPLLTFQPFSVWLGARIGLTVLAVLAGLMLPGIDPRGTANWYNSPGGPPLNGVVDRFAGVWTRWDGQWYLKIATEGYKPNDGSAAFFPLYPWLLRAVGWLAGERYIWAGILISSLFFLGALVLMHRLVRLDFHPQDANRTTLYLAAFPMAFFFWAVYSESLFLLLAVGTLLAARTQRWWLAALCISAAVWTRSFGIFLLLPLAWEMWRAYRPPLPIDPHAMPSPRPKMWSLFSLALPLLSLIGFLLFGALRFGDALAPLNAQTGWNRHFAWPWQTVVDGYNAATSMIFSFQVENQSWTYFIALIFIVFLGILSFRWLRGSYNLFLWSGILFPLFSETPHNPLLSYSRFVVVLFPAFIVLALIGRNRYAHQVILWTSLLLLALFTIRFANWFWVA